MSFACIYGTECTGCVSCDDCVRYVQPETQEEYNRRVDAAYDKVRDDDGAV